MKTIRISISVLFASLLMLMGCRKVEILESETCEPIPPGPDFGWNSAFEYQAWGPNFNPNDPDEIVFVFNSGNTADKSLVKYNIVSQERQVLYQGNLSYSPSWGANGWILFNVGGGHIFKIRENGTELTQLAFSGSCWQPHWNPGATRFAYYANPAGSAFTYLCDPQGIVLDTMVKFGAVMSWSHPRYSPYPGGDSLIIGDVTTDSNFAIAAAPKSAGGSQGLGAVFIGPDIVVYSYKSGLYSCNIHTHETKLLKASCNSALYLDADFSAQRQQIIWQKRTYEPISATVLLVKTQFVLTDINGGNEIPIPLDL